MHAYHPGLPGYDERQIWFDGCEECEHRAERLPYSIASLDSETFDRALVRSLAFHEPDSTQLGHVSAAETKLLDTIYLVYRGVRS